ncbi:MAG: hypothetical protein U0163_20895 [Gemmatimonadaceae bacterium]
MALTSIGLGYITKLVEVVEYVQEVMLDTRIDVTKYGVGPWHYSSIHDRFQLLWLFLEDLANQDLSEMSLFANRGGTPDEYIERFGTQFITERIVHAILNATRAIAAAQIQRRRTEAVELAPIIAHAETIELSLTRGRETFMRALKG